ncbi:MAG TPA: ribose-phosphate diphosphokinase [Longimicrobium sp.]|nr:ribose-phosphate diphosphokinase [Longimicrobium sp.]
MRAPAGGRGGGAVSADLFTVTDAPGYPLADALAGAAGVARREYERFTFANGNVLVRMPEPSPGARRVLVAAFSPARPAELLVETALVVDAARRAYDAPVHCLLPYLPYSRGNRVEEPRASFGARVFAALLDAVGADRIHLADLHSPELLGFFRTPVRHRSALPRLVDALAGRGVAPDWVVAPDCGRYPACRALAEALGARADFFVKWRHGHGGGSTLDEAPRPHLRGASVLLFDDEIGTGDTLVNAARAAARAGAAEIHAAVVFSFAAPEVLRRLAEVPALRSFTTTNLALPLPAAERAALGLDYRVVDCAGVLLEDG